MARSTNFGVEGDVITDPSLPAAAGWFTDPWEPSTVRYFDGRRWTDQVASASSAASGYPLGQRVLELQEQNQDANGGPVCVILDAHGAKLAIVSPTARLPRVLGSATAVIGFDVGAPNGRRLFSLARSGGKRRQCVTAVDAHGEQIGRLIQPDSVWRRVRTGRLAMRLEAGDHTLARTYFYPGPTHPRGLVPQHVHDSVEAVIATVTPLHPTVSGPGQLLGYRLDCPHPVSRPLSTLLSVVLVARYLYDRLEYRGGYLDQAAYWVSRPSWHQ